MSHPYQKAVPFKGLPDWAQELLKVHIGKLGDIWGGIPVPGYATQSYRSAPVPMFSIGDMEVYWIKKPEMTVPWRGYSIYQGRVLRKDGFEPGLYVLASSNMEPRLILFPRYYRPQDVSYIPAKRGDSWGTLNSKRIPSCWEPTMSQGVRAIISNVRMFTNPGTGGMSAILEHKFAFMQAEWNEGTNWQWTIDRVFSNQVQPAWITKLGDPVATFKR